ncbi:UDP-N-acetylmuramoyl-L-alanyl-D-glutamate--2,6-diaminopimelate ligase [Limnohabitans sp. Hippo3]|uniref:UDP-N-acetylmuramoyl-L-alanyl-D-glutamate--2, 6-diaminopimelate ligase n=1 Tax=Limnohabitans sp. Hippo3 TaxID=1597956 RepID=UPI000D36A55D|nr:UDP-N-acetylmuramoyl-L-alanyl-D-glutamate--2,6-diaminopimelate ligase [Limnohabitans sp. Hippo3]PUE42166.1 UDP-N-acetylmuramoyl-L-alanyl-D-glutamate--2,6-diaminopimelate ligase [Limnohabitans sp. Hippo3]
MQMLHNASEAARWLRTHVTGELRTNSRLVQAGDGFIAWPGAATDGRRYLAAALAQGATACLMEAQDHAPWLQGLQAEATPKLAGMAGLKAQTGLVADAYYEHPSQALKVLAVTGTNGKTSTAWWLAQALSSPVLQQACGLVGTLGVGRLPHLVSTGMTTPDPVLLQRQFRQFVDEGVTHCAIEASSIGLAEHRLDGTRICVAVFTNFTQDHLDYHGDMARYWSAKAALFDWPGLQSAVVNIDDAQGALLAQQLQGGPLDVWTCSRRGPARLQARALPGGQGLAFEVIEGHAAHTLQTGLIGDYNMDNLLGVIGSLRALGFDLAQAVQACAQLTAVPGRMERVRGDAPGAANEWSWPLVVVDYAHTPDAITQALSALRSQAQARGGRLWCVLGCGGDRDASKRPLMAAAAEAAADHVVLTSDNPRSESPEAIVTAMVKGLKRPQSVRIELDRALAIAQAVAQAQAQDVVLVAGKGHESEQEIMGVRHPFSDVAQARMALQQRAAQPQGAAA